MEFDDAKKLAPGARLELTEKGIAQGIRPRNKPPFGEYLRTASGKFIVVIPEGNVSPRSYHPSFWNPTSTKGPTPDE